MDCGRVAGRVSWRAAAGAGLLLLLLPKLNLGSADAIADTPSATSTLLTRCPAVLQRTCGR